MVLAPPGLFAEPRSLAWPELFGADLGEGRAFLGACERAADGPDGQG